MLCWIGPFWYYPHVTLGSIFKIVALYNHALGWELTKLTYKLNFATERDSTLGDKNAEVFPGKADFPFTLQVQRKELCPFSLVLPEKKRGIFIFF